MPAHRNKFRSKSVRSAISRICTRLAQARWSDELALSNESAWGDGAAALSMRGRSSSPTGALLRSLVHWKTAEGSSGLSFGSCICRKDAFGGKKQRAMLNSAVQDRDQRSGHSLRAALDDEQHIVRSP